MLGRRILEKYHFKHFVRKLGNGIVFSEVVYGKTI